VLALSDAEKNKYYEDHISKVKKEDEAKAALKNKSTVMVNKIAIGNSKKLNMR